MFNSKILNLHLENDNIEKRAAFKEFLKDPIFLPRFGMHIAVYTAYRCVSYITRLFILYSQIIYTWL